MKSTSGQHFVALDHVRATAAFLVVAYHFTRSYPSNPAFPGFPLIAIVSEGYTGVSLFMVLSGYLFAKLLGGRHVHYPTFLYNRALRLFPLLVLVLAAYGVAAVMDGSSVWAYCQRVLSGFVTPSWPGTAWSITVELHFYLLLPMLLALLARSPWLLAALWTAALLGRWAIYAESGTVVDLAYWTIVGRIDQFLAGILAFHVFSARRCPGWAAALAAVTLMVFLAWFRTEGGFFGWPLVGRTEKPWVYIPALEAACYALMLAWYDTNHRPRNAGFSRFVALAGTYSYSIYLIHQPLTWTVWKALYFLGFDLRITEVGFLFSIPFFLGLMAIGHVSYRVIEVPFLRLRRPYLVAVAIKQSEPQCSV